MRRCVIVVAAVLLSVLGSAPTEAVPRSGPTVPSVNPSIPVAPPATLRAAEASGRHGSTSSIPSPSAVALDPRTDTLYVTTDSGSIAVVDARTCNTRARHCRPPVATLTGRAFPAGLAVDPARHTLYVAADVDADRHGLLVFDTRRCNARHRTGCGQTATVLPDPNVPIGLDVDEATHTLYVGHLQDVVGVLDTAVCNGAHPAGCTTYLASIAAGPGPVFPTVDHAGHTLYVPDNGPDSDETGTTLSVIDIARCRAGDTSGCGDTPFTATVGTSAFIATVDPGVDTVYVSNTVDNTISVLPRSTCSAADHSGCPTSTPPSVQPGFDPQLMVVDRVTQTLYVHVQDSNVLAAVDARRCNAHALAGCAARPRRISTGAQPFWLTFDPRTRTLYTPTHGADALQAIDARACSAVNRRGCRREAPIVPGTNGGWSVDPAHHTFFQVDFRGSLVLTDTDRCTAIRPGRCAAASVRVELGRPGLGSTAIDTGTHTAYVDTADEGVLLFDTATCNVARHDDCAPRARIALPDRGFPTVDPVTHTVYVGLFNDGRLAVIKGSACNATDASGCGATPLFVPVGDHPYVTVVDRSTDTVYVSHFFGADTVTVLPASACDAASSRCRVVATTAVGGNPVALAVDPPRHTLFATTFSDERPGTVALIDTRACNAAHPSGCGTTWYQAPGPRTPFGATVDATRHTLFTENIFDASVSVIDTRHCNAADHRGCPARPRRIAVGDAPVAAYTYGPSHTLYVATPVYATTSLIDLEHPCRHHRCFR